MTNNQLPKIKLPAKPAYFRIEKDVDFYELFKNIEKEFDTCFILESLGEESFTARYSVMGFDPEYIIRAKEKDLFINDKVYKVENPYFALREIIPQNIIARNYAGGLVGYISYEGANFFETNLQVKVHPLFDQMMFGFYTDGLVFDKMTGELFYFHFNADRSDLIRELLKKKVTEENSTKVVFKGHSSTKEEHKKAVENVKKEIIAGNTFQCEVGFKSEYEITGNTLPIYTELRKVNPSPFMYYVKFKDKKIIGASPELLFRLRNGEMETFPLAGTAKRGSTVEEDRILARELLNDPKEIAEHNMLVDLHRNDLGRVARFGTVKVRSLMDIKKFSHVQHISSEIVGLIKNDEDMFSGLASNFPAGTLSGAPKIESMKIIDRNENQARGPYGGALGHFGFNGDCTFAIPIRTLFISENYGYTQTSSGIVYDSDPDKEYAEIEHKLAAMKKVLDKFI